MTDTIDHTTRLSGEVFSRVVRAGALAVVREQESLNRINVFPVRDADTGANLAATLKAAASRLGSAAPDSVGDAARVAADGALDGARGNSGAIFAQFLHGLASSMERLRHADGTQFAAAAVSGTESAYSALQDPREGTILSVLRAWSHELTRRAHEEDLPELLHSGLVAAREALAATPRQLEVLARSHVVDAGGQGFVFFLEGLIDSLTGNEPAWVPIEAPPHGLPPFSGEHDEIDDRFRFCTEALLTPREGVPLSRDDVMTRVTELGESLVVAGGDARLRVHIHTNEPKRFFASRGRARAHRAHQGRRHGAAAARLPDHGARAGHRLHHRPARGRGHQPRPDRRAADADAGRRGVPRRRGHHARRVHPADPGRRRRAALVAAGGLRPGPDVPPAAGVPRRRGLGAHRGRPLRHGAGGQGGRARGRPRAHPRDRLVLGVDRRRPAGRGRRRGHQRRRRPGRGRARRRAGQARDQGLRRRRLPGLRRARRAHQPAPREDDGAPAPRRRSSPSTRRARPARRARRWASTAPSTRS